MTVAMMEHDHIPYLEWVVYKKINDMAARDVWKLAVSTRSPETIQHLVELLHVSKQLLIIVTGKTPQKAAADPFKIPMEEMIGTKKEEPIIYDSAEMLFLLPFKFPPEDTLPLAGH